MRLHHARTCQGISIAEAAAATRILPCYLVALEAGTYASLPSRVSARGFIRNYASYLEICAEELIELYHCECGPPEPIRIVSAITTRTFHRPWLGSFVGVSCVVLLLVATSYFVLRALT
jgi:cytoskeletal protein RodZ